VPPAAAQIALEHVRIVAVLRSLATVSRQLRN